MAAGALLVVIGLAVVLRTANGSLITAVRRYSGAQPAQQQSGGSGGGGGGSLFSEAAKVGLESLPGVGPGVLFARELGKHLP